eukprot:m.108001 g.108001  ORF g.108001 m.108001 type:complete len:345 (+) comp8994_c0_seq6:1839-2873(+)
MASGGISPNASTRLMFALTTRMHRSCSEYMRPRRSSSKAEAFLALPVALPFFRDRRWQSLQRRMRPGTRTPQVPHVLCAGRAGRLAPSSSASSSSALLCFFTALAPFASAGRFFALSVPLALPSPPRSASSSPAAAAASPPLPRARVARAGVAVGSSTSLSLAVWSSSSSAFAEAAVAEAAAEAGAASSRDRAEYENARRGATMPFSSKKEESALHGPFTRPRFLAAGRALVRLRPSGTRLRSVAAISQPAPAASAALAARTARQSEQRHASSPSRAVVSPSQRAWKRRLHSAHVSTMPRSWHTQHSDMTRQVLPPWVQYPRRKSSATSPPPIRPHPRTHAPPW